MSLVPLRDWPLGGVAQIQADVAQIKADIQQLQATVNGLQFAIGGLQNSIANMMAVVAGLNPPLQWYGGPFDAPDLEVVAGVVGAGSHLEVFGWLVSASAVATSVSLRSGNVANNGTSVPIRNLADNFDATILFPIGAGMGVSVPPGGRPLWRTVNDTGLIVRKENPLAQHHVQVFFRTVSN